MGNRENASVRLDLGPDTPTLNLTLERPEAFTAET